jgi:homoisocitrate dehydrogenase
LLAVRKTGAALFGAVSSPSRKVEGYRSAILTLRQGLNLYANIRPVRSLPRHSPRTGVDLVIVRENTEGLYAGIERRTEGKAIAERVITWEASRRIGLQALGLARLLSRRRLAIVHKANILPVSDGLFRDAVYAAVEEYRREGFEIEVNEVLVDTAAYQLASSPEKFDILVTTNLFGDILSDVAAVWCGGMGMAASINLGDEAAIAEPVHGSAPDIVGKGIANPIAAILSAALLARYTWKMEKAALQIENAVARALEIDLDFTANRYSTSFVLQTILSYIESAG